MTRSFAKRLQEQIQVEKESCMGGDAFVWCFGRTCHCDTQSAPLLRTAARTLKIDASTADARFVVVYKVAVLTSCGILIANIVPCFYCIVILS